MSKRSWWIVGALLALLVIGVVVGANLLGRLASAGEGTSTAQDESDATTVPIQPASALIGAVSASGNIALREEHYVTLGVDGTIARVFVRAGDAVQAGDPLLALDTVALERAVRRSELNVQSQVNRQQQLEQDADALAVAAAQANLASALENLALVRAGPSNAEIAAARSSLSSAQARYAELVAGPSELELLQLAADVRRREVSLAQAQENYNAIAWRNDVGMTPQAAELQQATIDYETAQANYLQATAQASQSELQSAQSSIQSAQVQLDNLLRQPTEGDIAAAEAQVAQTQSALDDLLGGATETELRDAQISLEQALVDLQEAYANLAGAQVMAPIDGTVLAVDAAVGRQGNRGAVVVTMADTSQLELTINVAEVDISQVALGQTADITIDALPGQLFRGEVSGIAPAGDASTNLVNFPVTIRLVEGGDDLSRVRPGMTAVATLVDTDSALRDGWLVPTSALRAEGDATIVRVVRSENGASATPQPVTVETLGVQGEWTIVRAVGDPDGLRPGDEVVGTVTSRITNEFQFGGGPPGRQ